VGVLLFFVSRRIRKRGKGDVGLKGMDMRGP